MAGGGRALWSDPGRDRVGWLDLATGAFTELFTAQKYAKGVVTDGAVAIGLRKEDFLVLDPAVGKKPRRFPAKTEQCRRMALSSTHLLTFQSRSNQELLHVWNRKTFGLEKVVGRDTVKLHPHDTFGDALSPSGHAAFYDDKEHAVEVWGPPWDEPTRLPMPKQPPLALGLSSNGSTLAVLFASEVRVVELANGKEKTVKAPSPNGQGGALRADASIENWVHPLPGGELVIIDFARFKSQLHEAVVSLYGANGKLLAAESVVFDATKNEHGLAEAIAISDTQVLLNQERLVEIV